MVRRRRREVAGKLRNLAGAEVAPVAERIERGNEFLFRFGFEQAAVDGGISVSRVSFATTWLEVPLSTASWPYYWRLLTAGYPWSVR